MPEHKWEKNAKKFERAEIDSPYKVISLSQDEPMQTVDYFLVISDILSKAGVDFGVISDNEKDHLIIHKRDFDRANTTLKTYIEMFKKEKFND